MATSSSASKAIRSLARLITTTTSSCSTAHIKPSSSSSSSSSIARQLLHRSRHFATNRPELIRAASSTAFVSHPSSSHIHRRTIIMDHAPPSSDTTDGQSSAAAAAPPPAPPTKKKLQVTSHNQYDTPRLLRSSIHPDPLEQFNIWLQSALNPREGQPQVHEPEAMTVSTCVIRTSEDGKKPPIAIPSSRVVLLKQVDDRGFIFYTNYHSRKSRELVANPYASCAFYWRETSRSVRVSGRVEKVSRAESEEYFASRPRGSQIGAWASAQSEHVGEDELEGKIKEVEKRFEGKEVTCPPHWGGWRIVPFEIEFWSGQPSRLHDRFRYTRSIESLDDDKNGDGSEGKWEIKRLSP